MSLHGADEASPKEVASVRSLGRRVYEHLEEIVSGTALVIVVLSASWGVVTRYLTETPATWAGELATLAFAWVVFVGASTVFKHGGHVSIDMLINFLPPRWRPRIQAAMDAIVLVFCAAVTALAVRVTMQNWDNPTSVMRVPIALIYLSLVVGFGMMSLRQGELALRRWRLRASGG
ncbi:MAG: TRAP transporter small permease [Burkholderiales bacterium]|nr:TRAP transporter small permease [Burkholderiales bacterium]